MTARAEAPPTASCVCVLFYLTFGSDINRSVWRAGLGCMGLFVVCRNMADPFATPGSHSVGRTLSEASLQMLVHSFVMVQVRSREYLAFLHAVYAMLCYWALLQAQRTEDSRAGLEALSRKLDVCGYDVGRRFTER